MPDELVSWRDSSKTAPDNARSQFSGPQINSAKGRRRPARDRRDLCRQPRRKETEPQWPGLGDGDRQRAGSSHDSGGGNGPFRFGWHLSLPAITKRNGQKAFRVTTGR